MGIGVCVVSSVGVDVRATFSSTFLLFFFFISNELKSGEVGFLSLSLAESSSEEQFFFHLVLVSIGVGTVGHCCFCC